MTGRALAAEVRAALGSAPAPAGVATAVRGGAGLRGRREVVALEREVRAELFGAGPLVQALLEAPDVTDVLVNSPTDVFVDAGIGLERVDVGSGVGDVRALAVRLAAAAGQRLDDASPVVDGRLPDGTRLHAVLPPIAAEGAVISLRTVRRRALTLDEWRAHGGIDDATLRVLRAMVQRRANVLVSGATGSGKTTLLASLLSAAAPAERIVCIEEARELAPDHPHVVHLQSRAPNVQGTGGVGLPELVRAAMRMRPDRLVLGECRGAEVREVLTALNTGHDGGLATVHANAAADVPARLVALGALAGLAPRTIAAQATSALDAVVHLARAGGRRHVREIAVLVRDGGELGAVLAAERPAGGELRLGPGWPVLGRRLGLLAPEAADCSASGVLGAPSGETTGGRPSSGAVREPW
ncbi:type II secretion system protein E [Beutenbergia cavernae DSM 12333]|uniref:Type II secretion system protein E n=1 Tax=Beutenbergia cavernae (strain ATCC BAA-8 / DSM 12333 / CCUG 43141 / JCM 11478 / NBRC 16432 / NCIMB 13614 / HKI 0122) TaxID=471853 RepID=C5BXY7_BEUC1|nr:TadA family conjugal transfer-associated ATPase [Beutenbergia cavernae]ACQ78881.1 type II secretion system protein E [Beutenbergia cavernae DSM 12333]